MQLFSKLFSDALFLVALTVFTYLGVRWLQQKAKGLAILNPTLWAGLMIIGFIKYLPINFHEYIAANKTITFFLGPMTIALGFSMYEGWALIKHYFVPLMITTVVSTLVALGLAQLGITVLKLEGLVAHSALPKSVTSPIGLLIIDRIGGIGELAVFGIIWAGVVGNLLGPFLFKVLKIKTALAQGYALGAVAHVLGMSRANEMGKEQGAAASAAIGFTGILTILIMELLLRVGLITPL